MIILTACLSIYGATAFQTDEVIGVKTLSGREITRDPVQSSEGWAKFTSGWLVGGLSGVAWSYVLTQILPYYSKRRRRTWTTPGADEKRTRARMTGG